jgi:hypothetical protein
MIEINTLIRFLNKDPDLHLELWEAEGDRNAASIIEEHNELHTERWSPMPVMDGVLDEKRERVRNARAKALAARTAGVGKKGPVMPSMAKQLMTIAEPAASEAYTFGYRPMSWETHTNPRVFLSGAFVERNDGTVSYSDATEREDLIGVRALSLTTFASTLELVAIILALPIEESARAVLRSFVPRRSQAINGSTVSPTPSAPKGRACGRSSARLHRQSGGSNDRWAKQPQTISSAKAEWAAMGSSNAQVLWTAACASVGQSPNPA